MTVRVQQITQAILLVRGHRVILDAGIAALYGVTTKALNQAVKRNVDWFPAISCSALRAMRSKR